ncbi:MAG: RHS repeat-associated core domain-containing protein, partial [Acidobacteria bacterium]|nr:RHS repeat-associated core domain-containing protein [Acidobacteriota bacterium]
GSGSMTLDYDLSNRVSGVSHPDGAEQYRYAPDNRRVWRSAGRTACYASRDNTGLGYWSGYGEGATEQVILYSPGGQKMGAYCLSFSANLQYFAVTASEENVYYGGRLVGKRLVSVTNSNNGLVSDFTADRLQSKGNGSNYYPYGESKTSTAGDDREGFATYTRDEKSGLDYADQRWYASGVGRFGTPDPFSASGSPNDPGSLNRYAYVSGDPTNFNDPEGLAKCYVVSATSDHSSEVHCTSQLGTRFERVKLNDFYGNPMSDTDLGKYKRIVEATIGVQLDDDEAQEGKSKINAAVNYAIQLLNANPDCEQLYGRSTRPEMFGQGAVSILQSLRSKDSFHWVEPGRGFDVSARTSVDKNDRFGFVWSWTASIALDVQTHSQQWHNMQELTHTVLHELGHVLAELGFMGGEFSHNDGNLTDPEEIKNQARNNALISERCFRII